MFVERSVDGTPVDANDERYEKSHDTSLAEVFLKAHPMAKIVVIIDTHCLENGTFVWSGDTPVELKSCTLLEVGVHLTTTTSNAVNLPTDPAGLLSQRDVQIPIQQSRNTDPSPQILHPESCLWCLHLSGSRPE
jgi:hypothetical protein